MKIDWKRIDTKKLAAIVITKLKEKGIDAFQAIAVVKDQRVDLKEVKRWSINEGHAEKFKKFIAYTKKQG